MLLYGILQPWIAVYIYRSMAATDEHQSASSYIQEIIQYSQAKVL